MNKDIYLTPNLINEAYLKAYSPLPVNYNYDDIQPFITIAERIWVTDILGIDLYEELLAQVEKDEITTENSTLLLKIYPYLAIAITFEALPFIAYHFSEVGITRGKSDNSDSIDNAQLTNIQNHIRTELELLKKMLIDWLNDNHTCYPKYRPTNIQCACADNCIYADMLWQDVPASTIKALRWKNLYNILKSNPNANIRLYSNNGFH